MREVTVRTVSSTVRLSACQKNEKMQKRTDIDVATPMSAALLPPAPELALSAPPRTPAAAPPTPSTPFSMRGPTDLASASDIRSLISQKERARTLDIYIFWPRAKQSRASRERRIFFMRQMGWACLSQTARQAANTTLPHRPAARRSCCSCRSRGCRRSTTGNGARAAAWPL